LQILLIDELFFRKFAFSHNGIGFSQQIHLWVALVETMQTVVLHFRFISLCYGCFFVVQINSFIQSQTP